MFQIGPYCYKIAETPAEFEQIHHLNYQTFVREIPQHADTGSGQLVDKFHDKNTYMIALRDGALVAMLCYHDQPPFSAASRMPNPEMLDAPGLCLLEVRLMTVIPEERHSPVLAGLIWALLRHAKANGYTHFLISSISTQRDLHLHMGFELLGPDVGPPEARYAPMMASVARVEEFMGRSIQLWEKRLSRAANGAKTSNENAKSP